MINTVNELLITLHNFRNNKSIFNKIVSENLNPYSIGYEMDDVIILGLFFPTKGQPVVICCDGGSLIAVKPKDLT